MGFLGRLAGVFFSPAKTTRTIAEKPVWLDACIILLIVIVGFTCLVIPHARMLDQAGKPFWPNQLICALFLTHLYFLGFVVSSLVLLIAGRLVSGGGHYTQVFSLFVYASFIDKILGNAVRLFLFSPDTSAFKAATSIARFFPHPDENGFISALSVQIDFFQIWLFAVIGIGLAAIFKMDVKKAMCVSYGFWLFKSVINAVLIQLGMSLFG